MIKQNHVICLILLVIVLLVAYCVYRMNNKVEKFLGIRRRRIPGFHLKLDQLQSSDNNNQDVEIVNNTEENFSEEVLPDNKIIKYFKFNTNNFIKIKEDSVNNVNDVADYFNGRKNFTICFWAKIDNIESVTSNKSFFEIGHQNSRNNNLHLSRDRIGNRIKFGMHLIFSDS